MLSFDQVSQALCFQRRPRSPAKVNTPIWLALHGAAWVSFHHGGGVGMGYSLHAGQVTVADGSEEAAFRLERVLTNDPGTGVMRHVHAGYEQAKQVARERGLDLAGWDEIDIFAHA